VSTEGEPARGGQPGVRAGHRDFDITVAHPARIWDYWLGGKDNFAADRQAGDKVLEILPVIASIARADRAFLIDVVSYLATEVGLRQFLDIGTGLPTANNTHEVAQRIAPESRIVYVDNDPIVLSHARALLTSDPRGATAYIDADLRDTGSILAGATATLDFSEPIGLMLLAILQFVPDSEDPYAITAGLVDRLPSGSYLAVVHASSDIQPDSVNSGVQRYNNHSAVPIHPRTKDQVARFFDGLELVGPGVVPLGTWKPEATTEPATATEPGTATEAATTGTGTTAGPGVPLLPAYCALGRKP
jgi:hypothetical protein